MAKRKMEEKEEFPSHGSIGSFFLAAGGGGKGLREVMEGWKKVDERSGRSGEKGLLEVLKTGPGARVLAWLNGTG